MSLKTTLSDMKRWAEHFWAWDVKPFFGKEPPSAWIVGKISENYVLMHKFTPVVGYLPSSEIENKYSPLARGMPYLKWAKSIHAYVEVVWDAVNEMVSNKLHNSQNSFVFSSYEEANMNAVLQGLTDNILPFEDFGDYDDFDLLSFKCAKDFASMYSVSVYQITNSILNDLSKKIEKVYNEQFVNT